MTIPILLLLTLLLGYALIGRPALAALEHGIAARRLRSTGAATMSGQRERLGLPTRSELCGNRRTALGKGPCKPASRTSESGNE